MKIYNELGPGLKDSIYGNAFEELLKQEKIPYKGEPSGEAGQSLIEVLIALSIFVVGIATVGFLVLDANVSSRQGMERTQATLLANEGLEAARSIRDADFDNLTAGSHGIALSGNKWIFSGTSDTQDQFTRTVTITDIDVDTKKVDGVVTWQFAEARRNSVTLTDYLTDWNQTQGQAGGLTVDASNAALAGGNKLLQGITIQNTGSGSITIGKMAVWWSNSQLIEQIRINNTNVWIWNGVGTPDGRQPSGTELNIDDFTLAQGSGVKNINRIGFNGTMTGATFIIKFIMSDGSTKYVLVDLAGGGGGPEWENPRFAGVYNTPSSADGNDVFVEENNAYLVTDGGGDDLHVIDVSDHGSPSSLGSLELNAGANAVYVSGSYAFVASGRDSEELQVIDVSSPGSVSKVGTYNKQGGENAFGVAVSGGTAYLVTGDVGGSPGYDFYSIDISTPASPSLLGGVNIGNIVNDIAVAGNYAYLAVAKNNKELQVVNISAPASPSIAAILNLPGDSLGLSVFVNGNYAYVGKESTGGGKGEFYVIDISTPTSPILVSTDGFEVGAAVNGTYVSGTKAFLATNAGFAEFQVLNIATPSTPVLIGAYDLAANANSVFVSNNTAFVATNSDDQELVILKPN